MNLAKVVLITGCSSGFGRLIAENLAHKNYHVFATMRAVENRNANAARWYCTAGGISDAPTICRLGSTKSANLRARRICHAN
jgi:NADP-dependent 3-hydroxy acid dehydrogenase YdfG